MLYPTITTAPNSERGKIDLNLACLINATLTSGGHWHSLINPQKIGRQMVRDISGVVGQATAKKRHIFRLVHRWYDMVWSHVGYDI